AYVAEMKKDTGKICQFNFTLYYMAGLFTNRKFLATKN
ncbi:unnamed protein product, partial [marine sediment metagenome]